MNIKRAYSTITVKEIDEGKRIIRGIASTPGTDRMGDIVDPSGAEFTLPIPLLWQHDHDSPIGSVKSAKITDAGIEIVAELVTPTDTMPSAMSARLSEAWESIKSQLVRGLSIGFRPLEYSFMDEGGIRFTRWDWYELSAVTIPANAEASITAIKKLDTSMLASFGAKSIADTSKPVVTGAKSVSLQLNNPKEVKEMNIQEQLAALRATLQQKSARMVEIMEKASSEGRTTDAQEAEEYDTLIAEKASIEADVKRLEELEKSMLATAKPVDQTQSTVVRGASGNPISVKNTQKLEPGIGFARAAKCLALGHLEHRNAVEIAKSMYGDNPAIVAATHRLVTKTAVAPAMTTDNNWAGNLVGEEGSIYADFAEFLRPQTIIGRFGQGGIPSLRNVPFRTPLIGQTSGGDGYWVGEGNAKPLTKFDFSRTTLDELKVANIAVTTMEVLRDSNPSADGIIRDGIVDALRERMDIDFIDPSKSAVPGISPASILNGVSGIASEGPTAEDVRADIKALFSKFIAANNAPTTGVWLMPATTALALSLMQNPLGQAEFPGVGMTGGTLFGLPVIVSEYIPTTSAGAIVALVNASDIYIGDEGMFDVSMSTEASLQMDNAPANPTTDTTVLVSLWQRNLVGFRAERTINWARRRSSSAAYLTGVNWGAAA